VKNTRALLILLAVVVAAAAVLFLLTRREPPPVTPAAVEEPGPIRYRADDVPLSSRGIALSLVGVRASIHPDATTWLVALTCDEPEGCAGELEATLHYHGDGDARRLVMVGRFDAPAGGELRFEGMEHGSTAIDRVDRVEIGVRERVPRGAPTPEVID
jgi:hypothetical protein